MGGWTNREAECSRSRNSCAPRLSTGRTERQLVEIYPAFRIWATALCVRVCVCCAGTKKGNIESNPTLIGQVSLLKYDHAPSIHPSVCPGCILIRSVRSSLFIHPVNCTYHDERGRRRGAPPLRSGGINVSGIDRWKKGIIIGGQPHRSICSCIR